uniref:Uncharacterized protein n=1 Tax=Eutreptiella gymnastica TaxID=73025 RepID=A0A7S1NTX9_9EUGL
MGPICASQACRARSGQDFPHRQLGVGLALWQGWGCCKGEGWGQGPQILGPTFTNTMQGGAAAWAFGASLNGPAESGSKGSDQTALLRCRVLYGPPEIAVQAVAVATAQYDSEFGLPG